MNNFNTDRIRQDFPTLSQLVNDKPLVYFDNAATTQKPQRVLDKMLQYNQSSHANPFRSGHYLGVLATQIYGRVREKVKKFINAKNSREIIFTKSATEALNLVVYSWGMSQLKAGDEIVLCISEHHSNILPWQQVAKAKQAKLKYLYINQDFRLDMKDVRQEITKRTKLVSIAHMSNVLGTVYPVKEIGEYAHKMGALFLVDAAQSVAHMPVDVQDINADFLVFSGHKMLGPTGIGVLYGKQDLLESMPPFLTGGNMIEYVEQQSASFAELPYKFEAGTPNVEGVVGLGAAIDYLSDLGFENIEKQEAILTGHALKGLQQIPYVKIWGPKDLNQRGAVISFEVADCHPHDVASIVDAYGVALRAGHHCAQPLMQHLQVAATSRVSFLFYNTKAEIDVFIESLKTVRKWLGYGS